MVDVIHVGLGAEKILMVLGIWGNSNGDDNDN